MTMRTGLLVFVATACIWPAQGKDQPTGAGKPSAKEIFLHPRQMPYGVQDEAPNPATSTPTSKPKPKPKPVATDQAQSGQPAANGALPIVQASYSTLGIRYTVRKKYGDRATDVPANSEFHSGDSIQLSVEVNDTGYLYIIHQGTSGTWKAMFPSPEIEGGDNRVQKGHAYTVPPENYKFTFSGDPGPERLFAIFSRQPVQEIESLIYSLKGGQQTPAADPGSGHPTAKVLSASAQPIGDSQIAKMWDTYSRDLIIEKEDHEQVGQQQDLSVYVANPKGSPDSRVVADIRLTHK